MDLSGQGIKEQQLDIGSRRTILVLISDVVSMPDRRNETGFVNADKGVQICQTDYQRGDDDSFLFVG